MEDGAEKKKKKILDKESGRKKDEYDKEAKDKERIEARSNEVRSEFRPLGNFQNTHDDYQRALGIGNSSGSSGSSGSSSIKKVGS